MWQSHPQRTESRMNCSGVSLALIERSPHLEEIRRTDIDVSRYINHN